MQRNSFYNTSSSGLLVRTFMLAIVYSIGAILTHFSNIYFVQIFLVIATLLILSKWNSKKYFLFVLLITFLFIEYDVNVSIRLWHPVVLIALCYYLYFYVFRTKFATFDLVLVLYFIGISIVWVFFDSFSFSLVNLKQWVFYIGLVVVLYFSSRKIYLDKLVIPVMIALAISLLGVAQYILNYIVGPGANFIYPDIPNIEMRPVGFFSETTWLSEFALIFLIVSWFLYKISKKNYYIFGVLTFFIVIIITNTRNTYLALFVLLLFLFFSSLINKRIGKSFVKYVPIVSFLVITLFLSTNFLLQYIYNIMSRFNSIDSSSGRFEAFILSINKLGESVQLYFGSGYYWDSTFQAGFGTSIGAKSFNLFLMILHIYGVIGLLLFLLFLARFFLKRFIQFNKTKDVVYMFSLYVLVIYLSLSMFAPIHQYPAGAMVLALVTFLNHKLIRTDTD